MKRNAKTTLTVLLFILLSHSKSIFGDTTKADLELFGVPEFCYSFLNPKFEGTPLQAKWRRLLEGFDGPHHYCFGIRGYNTALKAHNREERMTALKGALNEMIYPLNHHFNPKHPLSAKLLYDLGKVTEGLEDYKSAIDFYNRSIELNPNVWLPFAAMSDLLEKAGNKKQAIETLENGLKNKPDSKPLIKRLNKLRSNR